MKSWTFLKFMNSFWNREQLLQIQYFFLKIVEFFYKFVNNFSHSEHWLKFTICLKLCTFSEYFKKKLKIHEYFYKIQEHFLEKVWTFSQYPNIFKSWIFFESVNIYHYPNTFSNHKYFFHNSQLLWDPEVFKKKEKLKVEKKGKKTEI